MKSTMKAILLTLCLFVIPCMAQAPLHNTVRNVTLQTPNNYLCFPVNANGPSTPIPYTCTGSATVLQNTTTWTSLTAWVNRPIVGSQQISVQAENFTTGNNIDTSACVITSAQMTCTVTFSASATAGDVLAVKLYNNLTGTASYNVEEIGWILQ